MLVEIHNGAVLCKTRSLVVGRDSVVLYLCINFINVVSL